MACCFSCRKNIPGYCAAHGKKCTDASNEHLCIWCDCDGNPNQYFIDLDNKAKASYSQPSYSQPSYSQPSYSQPSYSQPSYSQPSYSQLSYSQPSYSQLSYASSYSTNYTPPTRVQAPRHVPDSSIRSISIPRSSVKHSGAYIIRKNTSTGFDEILLQARAEHLGGVLCGPGGQINSNENDVVTPASREAWEEAGIDLSASVGVPFLKKGSVACVAFVVPSNIQVHGPRSGFANEINLRYNFSQIPGATPIPGTGHAWVRISTLITWLRNQPRRHELFVQVLEHLEH